MSKRYWMSASDLEAPVRAADAARTDEFGPDVQAAIEELRARHGIASPSCQHEGNTPDVVDRLRERLREMVPGLNRRGFLRLTGAAAVFSLAGCGPKHPDTVVPWAVQPEGSTLGSPQYYSSTLSDAGQSVAVMVKTYDGRPIKIEGNPDHPRTRGRCDTRTQAALLNLYDPDRLQHGPAARTADGFHAISWEELDRTIGAALAKGPVGLITPPVDSPARKRLLQALSEGLGGRLKHAVFEAYPRHAEAQARAQAFGDGTLPLYRCDRGQVLVCFGDFLGGPHQGLAEQVAFGDLRRLRVTAQGERAGQVFAFEPTLSQLGTCADVRVRVPVHLQAAVAWRLAKAVATALQATLPASAEALLARTDAEIAKLALLRPLPGTDGDAVAFCASQLLAAKRAGGFSLVWAGGANLQGPDSVGLHLAVAFLNSILGNEGVTVETPAPAHAPLVDQGDARALLQAAANGEVPTLLLWDVNPAYVAPETEALLAKVPLLVALADRLDESAVHAHYVVPVLHGLESWGDAETSPGIYTLRQPTLPPLWDSRAAEESLMAFAVAAGVEAFAASSGPANDQWRSVVARRVLWQPTAHGVRSWQDFVRQGWSEAIRAEAKSPADADAFWTAALARGVVEVALPAATAPSWRLAGDAALPTPAAPNAFALVLSASRTMRDGACLNNAWLQEVPDPVSKVCWDTYCAVSPVDAASLKLGADSVASLTVGSVTVKVPVHIQEGQQPGTLELFCGWGRTHAGQVAEIVPEEDGFRVNAFTLFVGAIPAALEASLVAEPGVTYVLARPQSHDFTEGRPVALEEVLSLRRATAPEESGSWVNGTDTKPGGDVSTLREHPVYVGHKWGMTVDMNTCIGCNACTVACTAENNVPVVGRDEVRKNRVMHWIRIHRYYSGSFDVSGDAAMVVHPKSPESLLDVEVIHQPMLCQHCDNAPCEPVCPANATIHNDEGLSQQIYNRCVGTRYCANNCPYKVRRFNWYQYSDYRAGPIDAQSPMKRIVTNLRLHGQTSAPEEFAHAPLQMLLNPEVTVRSRGVMEKCSLCIQRVRTIRDREHVENRRLPDGEITTACAQTCPTKALVFGDLNDPSSEVVRTAALTGTAYRVLDAELNTRPAISYLRRVRNRPPTPAEAKEATGGATVPEAGAAGGQG